MRARNPNTMLCCVARWIDWQAYRLASSHGERNWTNRPGWLGLAFNGQCSPVNAKRRA